MKLKRTLALLLCLAVLFAFAACGGNEEQPSQEPTPSASVEPSPSAETPTLPEIKAPQMEITFKDFSFKVNDKVITNADLKDCQVYKVTLNNILSKDGLPATNKETGEPLVVTYMGYKLADVLTVAGVQGTTAYAVASDGYESAEYDLSVNPDYLIVAIEKDKTQAGDGSVYFAPCFEQLNGKYVSAVTQIVVK